MSALEATDMDIMDPNANPHVEFHNNSESSAVEVRTRQDEAPHDQGPVQSSYHDISYNY